MVAMNTLGLDPEFLSAMTALGPPSAHDRVETAHELRERNDPLLRAMFESMPRPDGVEEETYTIRSYDGAAVRFTRFATRDVLASPEPTPAVVHVHGGGMVSGSVAIYSHHLAALAHGSRLPVFAVEWRLAPEHPAPTAVEDVHAVLMHVSAHAAELNIDPARIALYGDSAGGGVAAGAALLARDRGLLRPPLAKQVLVYPMLDDRTTLAEDHLLRALPLGWTAEDNVLAWDAYIGSGRVSSYAAPARAEFLGGLPSTYMDIGTVDLFRDENLAYATRLLRDGVQVEFHLWPGLPHGFEGAQGVSWTRKAMQARLHALQQIRPQD